MRTAECDQVSVRNACTLVLSRLGAQGLAARPTPGRGVARSFREAFPVRRTGCVPTVQRWCDPLSWQAAALGNFTVEYYVVRLNPTVWASGDKIRHAKARLSRITQPSSHL